MRLLSLRNPLPVTAVQLETLLQVRASTVHAPMPRHNDTLDAIVNAQSGVNVLQLATHEIGKGIDIQRRRLAPSPFTPEEIGFQGFDTVAPTGAVVDAFSL